MLIVLVIIAILLFLILIAIEPEALQAIGACIGLVVGLVVLIVGGVFLFSYLSELTGARQSDSNETAISADADQAVDEALDNVQAVLDAANDAEAVAASMPSERSKGLWVENIDGVSLTFARTRNAPTFRRLVEYRKASISKQDDSSCGDPYMVEERVTGVKYSWGFVIDRFSTWSDEDGQGDYLISESNLPRALQGSVRDIVKNNRIVRITKQRCGQGQVPFLVAVHS